MTTTPTSGAADLPEALRLADIADDESWAFVIGVRKDIAAELRRLHALAAGQATAAQQGAAYAALPTSSYAGRVYEEGFLIGTCPLYTVDQLHAFADATHTLRASHGQAPAGATLRSMIEGMSVSVDVSTGDHDAGHRYFGTVTEAMECQGDKHGVTLLVQDAEPNFAAPTPQAAQPAPATQQAGEVRRAELVPGVMHCAKCKFQLNRVTLCVSDGNAYAGNNKTEPCPNGCGPLWPVTWEQEAKNCWKALEEMHERLMAAAAPQPSPTAQADSVQEDAARLDWLEQNLFHREMDEWDVKFGGRGDQNMWVLFAPKGVQGSARRIISAARARLGGKP